MWELRVNATLAGGIAHDFNNILTPIMAHVDCMLIALPGESPLQEDIVEVKRAVARAKRLVGQILSFSRRRKEKRQAVDFGDIVLTDQTLPGMTGDELVGKVLALRPNLPTIICTGNTRRIDEERAKAVGAKSLLLKPFGIEEKNYRPLGDVKTRRSDFRLICATNQDLKMKSAEGDFRQDLLFRINVFPVTVPPLRERLDDLPGLIRVILFALGSPFAEVPPPIARILAGYSWPGNIRELRNVLERALILSRGGSLESRHFPGLSGDAGGETPTGRKRRTVDKVNENYIREVMDQTGGDTKEAANLLGISRATLYRRLAAIREES
jgi:DNA-binding NtrC family response regulator